ncbi:amidase [Streptomyces albofaciens JCM 4342]|uniref:amidase n=1 Tax=Streptomyces albofaciens TaxID=66866 RepID=UPI00123AFF07|nr:amidase [Streptomyces albofaciens]KAA6214826.1 amidase [Streptomyces albofaciens JCM 4342]
MDGTPLSDTAGLHRRRLLGLGAAAAPALLGLSAPRARAAGAPAVRPPATAGGDGGLHEASLTELRDRLAGGKLTSVALTRFYLDRIAELNHRGPALHAVLETNPDALELAATLDAERRAGKLRGPLHGIPLLIKDNIGTADKTHTSSGLRALLGVRPAQDATVVARLRAAGAVPLGKGNLTSPVSGSSGYSQRGGQTRNPYKLDRSPNGSSAGPAVATAAGLCAGAVGTETIGSILGPAGANGVVGLRPTTGLTSRTGMFPGARSFDTIGPLCRTVADAALLLGVLTGVDPTDAATAASEGHFLRDYTPCLKPGGLRGARIGVVREVFTGYSPHADSVLAQAVEVLKDAGATVVDHADIPTAQQLTGNFQAALTLQLTEMKHDFEQYLARTPGTHPRSLAELIAYNKAHADTELEYFGQSVLEMLAAYPGTPSDAAYKEAVTTVRRVARDEGVDAALRKHRVDALLMPTGAPSWKIDMINGDPPIMGSALAVGYAGYPAISVPAGFVHGLPVGVTFAGPAWSEPALLRFAHAFESAHPVRRAPAFTPASVGL